MNVKRLLLPLLLCGFVGFLCFSCSKDAAQSQTKDTNELVASVSLTVELHKIDSFMNSGQLVHLDVYEIGKLKSISISAQKVTAGDLSTTWINMRKDCGNEYYYSFEDARLLSEECPYFINAINTINSNRDRGVDHEERFAYMTKDDIRILAYSNAGKKWTFELSVDCHKQNSSISLNTDDIEELITLIEKAQSKIKEIK